MLLSALDPALLFYKSEDWQYREPHCLDRFQALALHLEMTEEYCQKIAMSDALEGLMWQSFPWDAHSGNIGEVHDLRQLMYNSLARVKQNIGVGTVGDISLQPAGIVCKYIEALIEATKIVDAWKGLLCGCVDRANSCQPQIATWETSVVRQYDSVSLTIRDPETGADAQYDLPLVWDDGTWYIQLTTQDWWPDLQRCVKIEFKASFRKHSMAREQPIRFKCSTRFCRSLDQSCKDKRLQSLLVKALTKAVYGIHDEGLGYEKIGEIVRFKVTDFWRVHGRMEDDQLVLLEFGQHDIGGVD